MSENMLAISLGSSGGKAVLGRFSGGRLELTEVRRFPNEPMLVDGKLRWDIDRLMDEIKQSIRAVLRVTKLDCIGICTWGSDYALYSYDGSMTEAPVNFTDKSNVGLMAEAETKAALRELFELTGNRCMDINTAFRLMREDFSSADTILFIPDIINHILTGAIQTEESIASTAQLLSPETRQWSHKAADALGIPTRILPSVAKGGTMIAPLRKELCEELDAPAIPVAAVLEHDIESDMAAVPAHGKDYVYISCGVWSIMGTETDAPILTDEAFRLRMTNECFADGRNAFLRSFTGLWMMRECREKWSAGGMDYTYDELEEMASYASPFACFIDVDDDSFVIPGSMPAKISDYCRRTSQQPPVGIGGMVRCIYESLAMKYRSTVESIEMLTDRRFGTVYMMGSGIRSGMLCSMTANACGRAVIAGGTESTIIGNMTAQLVALKVYKSFAEARCELNVSDENVRRIAPKEIDEWNRQYERYKAVLSTAEKTE